ncbi:sigma-54 dependent transcriptional regulator [Thermosipho africanus H17ap60334]|uniref:Sigma-54 dependent transcriptional regulator n=1 Tax=Thermosipho africanus (strain TCF52B) TaxID=484019 RepID=B7IFD2_THEAB|nr:sigma-54-dependent Fis family transcriptional regulator [Thermosipho africanus]ACJ74796.1 sigma-54 dependent transcriptional regulator [Thermosipho africanus TCF52B]EKF48753.1 sigma-54 dependent transcriptional regulator [Thermosipho africanus H17ap60334]
MELMKFYRTVLESIIEGVIIVDSDARILYINKMAVRLLNLKDGFLGKHVVEVIPNTRLHIVVRTGIPEVDEVQNVGDNIIITSRMPLKDENDNVVGAVAVFRDITSMRKLAEEITNLHQIEARLKAIIDSTYDAISVADENGNVVLVNKAYTKITGLKPEDVIGKPATVDIAEGESIHMLISKTKKPIYNARLKVYPSKREVIVNALPLFVKGEFRGSVAVVHDVSEILNLTKELEAVKRYIRHIKAKYTFDDIIGQSEKMLIAKEQAKKVAKTPATVLLRGESGTGKELFAHAIHNASNRSDKPFVTVNCAAIPENMLEVELFGYVEDAFMGTKGEKVGLIEEADGGTLFLDEIGKMPLSLQAKIVRFIENGEFIPVGSNRIKKVNVRIIASTNMDLEQMLKRREFLSELYYRLNVFPIFIPPLRERKEDIDELANHFVKKISNQYRRNITKITDNAISYLKSYDWPGNVRELENVIGRAIINMSITENVLDKRHFPTLFLENTNQTKYEGSLKSLVEDFERKVIEAALRENKGDRNLTAKKLGISLRTLYYKMERYGLI